MKRLLLAGAVLAAVGCAGEPTAVRVPQHKTSEGDPCPTAGAAGGDDSCPVGATESSGASGADGTSSHVAVGPDSAPTSPSSGESAPTSAPETTTTEPEPEPVTTTTPRRTTTTERPTQLAPVVHGDDFWYRLAGCESGNGRSSANQFQFMGGTAEKVGYYAGASYEEQRAMAIDWAARIHPREGSSAGWPVCWFVAGGS